MLSSANGTLRSSGAGNHSCFAGYKHFAALRLRNETTVSDGSTRNNSHNPGTPANALIQNVPHPALSQRRASFQSAIGYWQSTMSYVPPARASARAFDSKAAIAACSLIMPSRVNCFRASSTRR